MKNLTYLLSASLSLASFAAVTLQAQAQESAGNLVREYLITPKSGHAEQYEMAVAEYREWCEKNGDPWQWMVYRIVSGEHSGSYIHVSAGHTWKEINAVNKFRQKAQAEWQKMVSEHVDSVNLMDFQFEEKLSRYKPGPPRPLASVTTYYLKPFATMAFVNRFQEVTKQMSSQDSPPDVVALRLLNGGQPRISFVHPADNAEDVGRLHAAIEKLIIDMGPRAETLASELSELTEREESAYIMLAPKLSSSPEPGSELSAK